MMQAGCSECAKTTGGCGRHSYITSPFVPSTNLRSALGTGWVCPRCKTVSAPWMPTCGNRLCAQTTGEP